MGNKKLNITLLSVMATALFGCGGGSDSGNNTPEIFFTVSSTAKAGGSISPTTVQVAQGRTASLTVNAATGFQVDAVSGCNGTLNGTTYTTGQIAADCNVQASFKAARYVVNTKAGVGGTVQPEGLTVQYGDKADFTLQPELAYQVKSAIGCNGKLVGNVFTTGAVASDCEVNVTFEPIAGGAVIGRYIDNGDGTVTDPTRKLMWMRCSFGQTWQNGKCNGNAAFASGGSALNLKAFYNDGRYNDWRFPTLDELRSLVFCSSGTPSYWYISNSITQQCTGSFQAPTLVHSVFPGTPSGAFTYISSTVQDSPTGRRYYHVNFENGAAHGPDSAFNIRWRYVRDVR